MKRKWFSPLLCGMISVFTVWMACASLNKLVSPPSVKVDAVKIASLSFDDITLNFDLNIANPNPFGVQLNGYDYSIAIAGQNFLTGQESRVINIAGSGASLVAIPLTINFQKLYSLIQSTQALDSLSYQLQGHLQPGGLLAGFNIPFSTKGSFPNVRIPKVAFKGLKMGKMSLTGVDLELALGLDNNNIFGFDVGKLDYQIDLAGTQVAKGITQNLASIPAKSSGEIRLPISLNFMGLTSSLRNVLTGQSVEVGIVGETGLRTPFGELSLPLNTRQTLQILR